jgi:hypothetical protein
MGTFKYQYADSLAFNPAQSFYRGNLHCHSVVSDGKKTRKEAVDGYRAQGYSFLCFSEHNIYQESPELEQDDFILLPGMELQSDLLKDGDYFRCHHVNAFLGTAAMAAAANKPLLSQNERIENMDYKRAGTPENMLKYFKDRGCFCMYNHPNWSMQLIQDMGDLSGYAALEIYNHGSQIDGNIGYSVNYWDTLLRTGVRINAAATDDNHNNHPDEDPMSDSYGGWVCVNAPSLTREAIVQSILDGRFYSSAGPIIKNYGVINGEVFVECGPVRCIAFISGQIARGRAYRSRNFEDSLTYATYKPSEKDNYVRIECVDKFGNTAWSNPLYPAATL